MAKENLKKKKHFANYIVVLAIVAVVVYTIASFVLQFFGNLEISPTLTTVYFAFWTVELVNLARIKNSKVKSQSSVGNIQNINNYTETEEQQNDV